MAAARHRRIAWWLRGVALAALLAYLPGYQASRSGGLVEVERWFNHPVPLLGTAVVLTVVSTVVGFEFRSWWSQVGGVAVLVALAFLGFPIVFMSSMSSLTGAGDGQPVGRKVHPDHPDRVLTVTNVAFSIDPVYRLELLTGSGWSARHWDLGEWDSRSGEFSTVEWSGPDRITVTGVTEAAVFTVDSDGRPTRQRAGPR
ncbi:hypothetical protein ACIPLC_19895 [Kitasatospora sp. NPDC086801]|uniref:hypothetical protein n=1 Tax=Kitasatospora sp. NPDC086801 TaxID=3364066 RepID=UPI0037FF26E9